MNEKDDIIEYVKIKILDKICEDLTQIEIQKLKSMLKEIEFTNIDEYTNSLLNLKNECLFWYSHTFDIYSIKFKKELPPSYGLEFDNYLWQKQNLGLSKMHSKESKIITDIVDEETDWYIFNDHEWNHLVDCWKHTKDKYFQYVKNKNVVITAGAHIGLYTRFYSKSFKTVYAFEPNPLSFYCMVNNNQTDNVIKIQAALNDKNGLIKLEGHSPMSFYIVENKSDGFIPCFTIDSLALEQCDLIQLDVERNEYKALKGGIETIIKFKPTIILENGDSEEIKNLFISLNYVMIDTVQYDHIWVHKDNS